MTDLRKAAEMALEALERSMEAGVTGIKVDEAISALRTALSQPEQEPVGYIDGMYGGYMVFTPINPSAVYLNGTALYTTPPKQWVGLKDEEINKLRQQHGITSDGRGIKEWTQVVDFARAIEAAHGIKENT